MIRKQLLFGLSVFKTCFSNDGSFFTTCFSNDGRHDASSTKLNTRITLDARREYLQGMLLSYLPRRHTRARTRSNTGGACGDSESPPAA